MRNCDGENWLCGKNTVRKKKEHKEVVGRPRGIVNER